MKRLLFILSIAFSTVASAQGPAYGYSYEDAKLKAYMYSAGTTQWTITDSVKSGNYTIATYQQLSGKDTTYTRTVPPSNLYISTGYNNVNAVRICHKASSTGVPDYCVVVWSPFARLSTYLVYVERQAQQQYITLR
jgi:hypothetical protein